MLVTKLQSERDARHEVANINEWRFHLLITL